MSATHTPEPWQDDDSGDYVTTARVIRHNGTIICRLSGRNPITQEELDANARLIAAAPEMAALLRELSQHFDFHGWGVDTLLARIDGTAEAR